MTTEPLSISIIIPTIGRSSLQDVLKGITTCDGYETINPEIWIIWSRKHDKLATKLKKDFPQVHFLTVTKENNVSHARNKALDACTGDIIAFLGDDTIPTKSWLRGVLMFHESRHGAEDVLLGDVAWREDLHSEPLYQWLLDHAQFAFGEIRQRGADWRHFYTCNLSLKRSFLGEDRFDEDFNGWGFEDTELGYRLSLRGMRLRYIPSCAVIHDHEVSIADVIERTGKAQKNARHFESLHPEVTILPHGMKRVVLRVLLCLIWPLTPFSQKLSWWYLWKRSWVLADGKGKSA